MEVLADGLSSFADIHDCQDIVIQIDNNYSIIRLNNVAEKFFNTPTSDCIGVNIFHAAKTNRWDFPFTPERLFADDDNELGSPQLYFWRAFPLARVDGGQFGTVIIGHLNHDPYGHSFSKLYLENIIANVPHYIFWKDVDSTYLGCNDNFARFVGVKSSKEIFGKSDYDFYSADVAEKCINEDKRVLAGIALLDKDMVHGQGSTQKTIYRKSKVPLRNLRQEVIGILGIYTDITQRKIIEEQLKEAKVLAERASDAKTKFIANISHDLRTSLNVILGMSKLLRLRKHTSEQECLIDGLAEASHALMHQIDEIIDYSKIEEGKVSITKTVFDLRNIVEKSVDLLGFEASLKNIHMIIDYAPDIPIYINSDPVALKRIVLNLLGNAVKFCETGHVKISVNCSQQSLTSASIQMTVEDTGIGIPEDKLDSIFERFDRVEKAFESRYKGTGLGLSIVNALVDRLDGKVKVESVLGEGASFHLSLPVALCVDRNEKCDGCTNTDQPKVLIVDDYFARKESIMKLLPESNSKFVHGGAAMDSIMEAVNKKQPFDIVLIDDEVSSVGITELLGQLKHFMLLANSRVVLMTRSTYDAEHASTTQHTSYERITKPIKPSTFANKLRDLWRADANQKINIGGKNNDTKKILLVEDEELGQRYCQILFENLDYQLHVAGSGKDTLEKVANNDYSLILMDVGLPDTCGIDLAKKIHQQDRYKDIPIIALTAHLDVDKKQECLDAGMTDFINKPVAPEELYEVLGQVFSE